MRQTNLSKRLYSLDALRGFDMLWIMGADRLFHSLSKVTDNSIIQTMDFQLEHVAWNGFVAYDMIFPLFIFMAGVATPFSVGNALENGTPKKQLLYRVIKRGLLLILLGVLYNNGGFEIKPLAEIRIPSVLGRIGSAYLFANIIYLYAGKKAQQIWLAALLLGYWMLLRFTSAPGFELGNLTMEGNFVSYVDRLLIPGRLHLTVHDPEGLLSTIPAIGTGLLGIMTGNVLKNHTATPTKKAIGIFIAGVISVVLAQIWNLVFPINKNLWTSSFTLQAGGWSMMLMAVFYYIIDVRGYQKWAFFFRVIGMNSILIYLSGAVIKWAYASKSLLGWMSQLAGPPLDAVLAVVAILIVKWIFLFIMYQKKIFLKI
jgi:predicted acyltransferase